MTFEKISSEKFKAFEKSEIANLGAILGGAMETGKVGVSDQYDTDAGNGKGDGKYKESAHGTNISKDSFGSIPIATTESEMSTNNSSF